MPTTPIYGLPYPVDTDPVNVAGDMQSLATAVDTQLQVTSVGAGGYKRSFLLMGA